MQRTHNTQCMYKGPYLSPHVFTLAIFATLIGMVSSHFHIFELSSVMISLHNNNWQYQARRRSCYGTIMVALVIICRGANGNESNIACALCLCLLFYCHIIASGFIVFSIINPVVSIVMFYVHLILPIRLVCGYNTTC